LEINKILISILGLNGINSTKSSFLICTEFGDFKVKLVKVIGANGLDITDFYIEVPTKIFILAYLFKMFQIFGCESQFVNRAKLCRSRKFKQARANIYAIPLKVIEEILITFFAITNITGNAESEQQIKLNKATSSTNSTHKVAFSVTGLLNEAV